MSAPELRTRWLASLTGTIAAPRPIGDTLLVFNVLDAHLDGPRIKASVQQPSGDWIRVQPNGNWKLDVRLLFETDTGDAVFCHYNGVLKGSPELHARIASGESIDGSEMYFRSTPYFETSAASYLWMNDLCCIGSMRRFGGGSVVYDLYEVL